VTSSGIKFKGYRYHSEILKDEGYESIADKKGGKVIEVRYDEHYADVIWFYDKSKNAWIHAEITDEGVRRSAASWWEVKAFKEEARRRVQVAKHENIHLRSEKAPRINKVGKYAQKEEKIAKLGKTKTQNQMRITCNRKEEKMAERFIGSAESPVPWKARWTHWVLP
jgi:hypothetical protein